MIYFLDKVSLYYTKMKDSLFENINNESQFYTSVLTDMGYLVYPYKTTDISKINNYKAFTNDLNFKRIDINLEICDYAAHLRAKYDFLRQMDALHLSCCKSLDFDYFLTNDKQLLKIKEIKSILVDNL